MSTYERVSAIYQDEAMCRNYNKIKQRTKAHRGELLYLQRTTFETWLSEWQDTGNVRNVLGVRVTDSLKQNVLRVNSVYLFYEANKHSIYKTLKNSYVTHLVIS